MLGRRSLQKYVVIEQVYRVTLFILEASHTCYKNIVDEQLFKHTGTELISDRWQLLQDERERDFDQIQNALLKTISL